MIIVSDAHINKSRGNHSEFFKMLAAIEKTEHDLIFLGDIFDLWIALPRYEEDIHVNFIAWSREQKDSRTIGFLEGNHEFYLATQRAHAFTWCSAEAWWQDDARTIFLHGDQVNRKDKKYLAFRKLIKNNVVEFILRHLPYGPEMVMRIKHELKQTNKKFRIQIPWDEIVFFAENRFAAGVDTIFVGHFHQEHCYRHQEFKKIYLLPDWLGTQKVTLYHKNSRKISTLHWRDL